MSTDASTTGLGVVAACNRRPAWALALLRAMAFVPLLVLGPVLAWAQVSLQSVSSSVQGGVEVVRIEFSQPLARPPMGFAVQTPPRIALDFAGVSNALSSGLVEVNQGNLRTVTVAEAGERTRVVLNLVRPSAYQTQMDGKALLAKTVLPTRKDRRWEVELAPLTRMQAWQVQEIKPGTAVSVVGFTLREEKGDAVLRAEYLFVDGKAYGLRSSPA